MEETETLNWELENAVFFNNYLEVKRLIGKGADVNCQTDYGYTPMHIAALHNVKKKIFGLLLENGADLNAENYKGETPLKVAIRMGSKKTIDMLKKAGEMKELNWFLIEAIRANQYLTVKRLIREGAVVNCETNSGWTPLHFAAAYNANEWIFRVLLDNGANIHKRNIDGETPVALARVLGNKRAIKRLNELGVEK